tara:strand:- start:204 stop:731 length:528 start_codon:yes stop_codon:yes gene_type:complete
MDEQLDSLLEEGKIDALHRFQKRFSTSSVTITKISLTVSSDILNDVEKICNNIVNEKYGTKFCNPYRIEKKYRYEDRLVYVVKEPAFDILYSNAKVDNPGLTEKEFARISDNEYNVALVNLKHSVNNKDRILDTIYVREKVWCDRYTVIINMSEKNIHFNIKHVYDILNLIQNGG